MVRVLQVKNSDLFLFSTSERKGRGGLLRRLPLLHLLRAEDRHYFTRTPRLIELVASHFGAMAAKVETMNGVFRSVLASI